VDKPGFAIPPVANRHLEKEIVTRLNILTKPIGSLGRLEEFALRYCLCKGRADALLSRMRIYTFAGIMASQKRRSRPTRAMSPTRWC